MEYYRDQMEWVTIQSFLPEEYRLTESTLPDEQFLPWRNCYIHMDCYRPQYPKATVILLHGVGGNGRLLSFIALPLFRNGFEVVCPDLPLYGNTIVNGEITYQDWVDCAVSIVRRYQIKGPVFLIGLSAGGMLAYQAATECEDVRGVMVTCLLDQRIPLVTERTAVSPFAAKAGRYFLNPFVKCFPQLRLPMKCLVNMKAIANNTALVKVLLKDKRASGTRVPLEFIYSLLHPVIKIEPENFSACPILLMHPQKDRWTELGLSHLFFDALACPKSMKLLENAGHFPIEQPGILQMNQYCVEFIYEILKA